MLAGLAKFIHLQLAPITRSSVKHQRCMMAVVLKRTTLYVLLLMAMHTNMLFLQPAS